MASSTCEPEVDGGAIEHRLRVELELDIAVMVRPGPQLRSRTNRFFRTAPKIPVEGDPDTAIDLDGGHDPVRGSTHVLRRWPVAMIISPAAT